MSTSGKTSQSTSTLPTKNEIITKFTQYWDGTIPFVSLLETLLTVESSRTENMVSDGQDVRTGSVTGRQAG